MIDSIDTPFVREANSESFISLVLENSQKGPVLVNFWSRKAGPCLRQYPILDKIIHHYKGRILLVNIDTEQERVVARKYGITSVPTLKLFRNEKVIDTLFGYQSENDLLKVLDIHVSRASDQTLVKAIELYSNGDRQAAYEMLTEAIVNDLVNPRLPLAMCKLLKHEARYQDALNLLVALPEDIKKHQELDHLCDLMFFYARLSSIDDVAAYTLELEYSKELLALQQLVSCYVVQGQFEKALEKLKYLMEVDKNIEDNYPQKAMLKVFKLLRDDDTSLIKQYRPLLKRYTH